MLYWPGPGTSFDELSAEFLSELPNIGLGSFLRTSEGSVTLYYCGPGMDLSELGKPNRFDVPILVVPVYFNVV